MKLSSRSTDLSILFSFSLFDNPGTEDPADPLRSGSEQFSILAKPHVWEECAGKSQRKQELLS